MAGEAWRSSTSLCRCFLTAVIPVVGASYFQKAAIRETGNANAAKVRFSFRKMLSRFWLRIEAVIDDEYEPMSECTLGVEAVGTWTEL